MEKPYPMPFIPPTPLSLSLSHYLCPAPCLISCLIICILCDMWAQLKWQAPIQFCRTFDFNWASHIGSSCAWHVACAASGVSRGRRRKQCQSSWPMHHVNFHMEYKCQTSWNLDFNWHTTGSPTETNRASVPVGSVAIILHIRNVDRWNNCQRCVWAALVKEIIINY